MQVVLRLSLALCGLFYGSTAVAHPEGAPWGSADPDTFQSCAACHFDNEPVGRSPAIMLSGLPEYARAGAEYDVTLRFDAGAAANAGFLLSASSGAFAAIDEFVEARGNEIRSVKTATPERGAVVWSFRWRAGEGANDSVSFRAAANAGDNDRSPFGDKVHFRKFVILMRTADE